MPITVAQFLDAATSVGVLESADAAALRKEQAATLGDDAGDLARELVKSGKITKFQAAAVYQGKATELALGNYLLLDKLGAGGMGQVFRARHRRMDRVVAIKVLPKKSLSSPGARERFQREVKAAAQLTHPNIVTAFDADEAAGIHFLVMEFVDGSDLSSLVKKQGVLPFNRATNFVLQAAKGLEFAHRRGIVHRDVKPSNLLVDREGVVRILDMGLARIDGAEPSEVEKQAELTAAGSLMGTVDYMAPEQALDSHVADARADIYSLGCTWHYLLLGRPPYGGDTLVKRLTAHQQQPIPALPTGPQGVPAEANRIFQKLLAKRPDDRYASMRDVIADLERLAAGAAATSATPVAAIAVPVDVPPSDVNLNRTVNVIAPKSGGPATSSRPHAVAGKSKKVKSQGPVIAVAVVVLVALGLAGYMLMPNRKPDEKPPMVEQPIAVLPVEPIQVAPLEKIAEPTPLHAENPPVIMSPSPDAPPVEPAPVAGTPTTPPPEATASAAPPEVAMPTVPAAPPTTNDANPPVPADAPPATVAETPPAEPPVVEKLPIPSTDAVKQADALVSEVFKNDLAAAKTPEAKTALGEKILQQSTEQREDPAGLYAMLSRARDLAIDAGSVDLADRAITALVEKFKIDAAVEQASAFEKLATKTLPPSAYPPLVAAASAHAEQAIDAEQWDPAKRLSDAALNAARKSRDVNLIKQATELARVAGVAKLAATTFAAAEKKLEESPDDAAANLVVGRYLAFQRNDWMPGFEHLAKSSDPTLKDLATKSLANPEDAAARIEIGDAWWEAGDKKPADKADLRAAACYWYVSVIDELNGLAKTKVEKRLVEQRSAAPPPVAKSTGSKKGTANGVAQAGPIDCSKQVQMLEYGPTFDINKSWTIALEFAASSQEIGRRFVFRLNSPGGGEPFSFNEDGRYVELRVQANTLADNPLFRVPLDPRRSGGWVPVAFHYDAATRELVMMMQGAIVGRQRLASPFSENKSRNLLLGGALRTTDKNRYIGQVRNLWMSNDVVPMVPATSPALVPSVAVSAKKSTGLPVANGLRVPGIIDCGQSTQNLMLGPTFDFRQSWALSLEFETPSLESGAHYLLKNGDSPRVPLSVRTSKENLEVQCEDPKLLGKAALHVPLDSNLIGQWIAIVVNYDQSKQELTLYIQGKLAGTAQITPIPGEKERVVVVGDRGSKDEAGRFMGRIRSLWLGNVAAPIIPPPPAAPPEAAKPATPPPAAGSSFMKPPQLPIANGLMVPNMIDCAQGSHKLPIGPTFDFRRSWSFLFEFEMPSFEKGGHYVFKSGVSNRTTLTVRIFDENLDVSADEPKVTPENFLRAPIDANLLGKWVAVVVNFDQSKQELSVYVQGRLAVKGPVHAVPGEQSHELYIGATGVNVGNDLRRFSGRVRSIWLGNVASPIVPTP